LESYFLVFPRLQFTDETLMATGRRKKQMKMTCYPLTACVLASGCVCEDAHTSTEPRAGLGYQVDIAIPTSYNMYESMRIRFICGNQCANVLLCVQRKKEPANTWYLQAP
jgi:hypothetical protein